MDTITIKVDPSGKGDFTTINDALDSVEAVNDNIPVRIELAPGITLFENETLVVLVTPVR